MRYLALAAAALVVLVLFQSREDLRDLQHTAWWRHHVFFVSWHRHWKGVYLHFIPGYTVRVFLWGVDAWRKPRRRPYAAWEQWYGSNADANRSPNPHRPLAVLYGDAQRRPHPEPRRLGLPLAAVPAVRGNLPVLGVVNYDPTRANRRPAPWPRLRPRPVHL